MGYESCIQERENVGISYDLERMEELMSELGSPQDRLPIIHVAGTNGKGSTSLYLEAIYAENYKVGAFISPSFGAPYEMIRYNGKPVLEGLVEASYLLIELAVEIVEERRGEKLSSFEVWTALMFMLFAEVVETDIVIVEAGLGGMLDSTNVHPMPLATVITSIGMDHQQFLGQSRYEIAQHKAGIMRPFVPTFTGCDEEANDWLRDFAKQMKARYRAPMEVSYQAPNIVKLEGETIPLHAPGKHQAQNATLAWQVASRLKKQFSDVSIQSLSDCKLPGRFEKLHEEPAIYVDTAHNMEAIRTVIQTIEESSDINNPSFLFSAMKDKPFNEMMDELKEIGEVTAYCMDQSRSIQVEDLEGLEVNVTKDALLFIQAFIKNHPDETLIVTGSHAFIAEIKQAL
ncbi:hypothetical protein FLK61_34920 [Paenalkalicoccus suaedae]|uniref:tetrahydrofolate synthase n=1 Tax=Paenalkalicoccus suaedae TaxID=2592382 RepID=A0A859FGR7_9BACI|nr:Mur ligase family protein [Paenalkalicoccus suaedae]QKS71862.1 hypothetical protein FLK61_34920 [Paenalkalicoccus suaedae]